MNHGIGRLDLTGKDVTDRLIKLLGQRGYSFESKIERENVRLTKESLCSIGLKSREVETAASNSDRKTHGCPNSTSYLIGDEPRECSEILFDPKSIGRKVGEYYAFFYSDFLLTVIGIHQILADSIVKCDIGIQQDLCDNIILAGGKRCYLS
jgi:actin-related protein